MHADGTRQLMDASMITVIGKEAIGVGSTCLLDTTFIKMEFGMYGGIEINQALCL